MTRAFEGLWSQTFRYAAEHSPFYREKFRDIKVVPDLESLPTVDKQILSERNLDFLCVPRERIIEIVTTSGTTGKPLLWLLTESDVRRLALNERLSFECAGLTANDTVLVLEMIERNAPSAIVGVPSYLRVIADKAHETGSHLKQSLVKRAICIG